MLGAECRPRALCVAQHCGERDHLNDDLHIVTLPQELILIARAASIFDRASTRRPVSRSSSAQKARPSASNRGAPSCCAISSDWVAQILDDPDHAG
jgi:hypothetical protein